MATLMVLQKPMLAVYPPATLTAWYYAVGSVLTLAVCAFFGVRPVDFLLTGQWEVCTYEVCSFFFFWRPVVYVFDGFVKVFCSWVGVPVCLSERPSRRLLTWQGY